MRTGHHLTRRQFGTGTLCAAAAVSLLPASSAAASTELSPQMLATLDPKLQKEAAYLARYWRNYCLADASYDTDPNLRKRWAARYRSVIAQAEDIRYRFYPETEAERALIAWANSLVPPERKRVREVWGEIPGLSPKFQRFEKLFNTTMMKRSQSHYAWLALQDGCLRNPLTAAENQAYDAMRARYDWAWRAARVIIAAPAITIADRTLKRRAVEVCCGPPRLFNLKYRLMAQAKLKA